MDLDEACELADDDQAAKLYLSADDSNSTASPVIARRMIRAGLRVPASVIRPYEFLNYYDFSFEPARAGEVRIVPQLSSCPVDNQLNLQVALQSEARAPDDRRRLNLTLVVDTSGSMEGAPLLLARAALLAMASQLQKGDLISLIFWNAVQDVRLDGHEVSGPDDPDFLSQVDSLVAGGGTDLYSGLVTGYRVASANRADDRINRVIMISDGGANIGVTDEQLISSYADDEEGDEGIYLAGIGVGEGYNDFLMNSVTDAGRGSYVYLDSADEAQRMLGDRFVQVIDVAARGVRLELTLPWYMQVTKFFGEHISTDRTKVKPQHLAPNSAMVFFQVLEACDPALLNGDDRIQMRATWTRPFTREKRSTTINTTLNELAGDDRDIEKAAVIAGYAEALAAVEGTTIEEGLEILQTAYDDVINAPKADEDPDLIEIAELLARYAANYYGAVTLESTGDAGVE
jgi:Ca-activated chloride channel family protein